MAHVPPAARSRFALAAGAATIALEGAEDLNLLLADRAPAPERRRATTRKVFPVRRIAAAGAAVVLLGTVATHDVTVARRLDTLESERVRLEEEQIELRVRARELTAQEDLFEIEDRIEGLRGIYQSRRLFTPFFTRVVECLPEKAHLDRVAVERAPKADEDDAVAPLAVHLRGRTRDVDTVGSFVVSLEERALLSRIEVLRITERAEDEDTRQADRWFEFELRGEPVVLRQDEFIAAHETDDAAPEVAR